MKKLSFKTRNGQSVGPLGVGLYGHNNAAYGINARSTSIKTIKHLLDKGMRFFDMANMYGLIKERAPSTNDGWGETEDRFCEAIQGVDRDTLFIASKAGRYRGIAPNGKIYNIKPGERNFDPSYIESCFYEICSRLGLDYLDLFQLHGPLFDASSQAQTIAAINSLVKLKEKGLIGYIGISVNTAAEGVAMLRHALPIDAIQVVYNVLEKESTHELFERAQEKEIRIIAREPLARGFLAGAHGKYQSMSFDDIYDNCTHAVKKYLKKCVKKEGKDVTQRANIRDTYNTLNVRVARIDELCRRYGRTETLTQLALKFCMRHLAVTVTIPGITRERYIADTLGVLDMKDFEEELIVALDGM